MSEGRPTRESQERTKVWKPRSQLETPTPPEGFDYRWVRHSVHAEEDVTNVIGRKRQHYEPVMWEELSEQDKLDYDAVDSGRNKGVVRVGDLMLMKVPVDIKKQRKSYYEGRARNMQRAVDQELDKNNSDVMPIERVHKSRGTVGRRSDSFDD